MCIFMYILDMKTINISEFRQQCLTLVAQLPSEGILITRHGRPVAKLLPVRPSCTGLIGSVPDFLYDNDDELFSAGIEWNAQS